jgi:hypothetical protein
MGRANECGDAVGRRGEEACTFSAASADAMME